MFLRVIHLESRLAALIKGVVGLTDAIGKDSRRMRTEIAELKAEVEKLKSDRTVTVTVFNECPERAEKTRGGEITEMFLSPVAKDIRFGKVAGSVQSEYGLNRATGAVGPRTRLD